MQPQLRRRLRRPDYRSDDQLIDECAHVAPRDQRRLEIAHRAGGGVARVGEQGLAGLLELAVDPLERGARQEHFTANLDASGGRRRRARPDAERQGNRANGADVGGNILAARAIAASGAANQTAVLVRQRDAQAVDLQLGDVRNLRRRLGGLSTLPAPAATPLRTRSSKARSSASLYALSRLSIGCDVRDGLESLDHAAPNPLRRRIGRDQLGVVRFQPLELMQQLIELLVRDFRIVMNVVALFVTSDGIAQLAEALQHIHHKPAGATTHEDARGTTVVAFVLSPTPGNRVDRRAACRTLRRPPPRTRGKPAVRTGRSESGAAKRAAAACVRIASNIGARTLVERKAADAGAESGERHRPQTQRPGAREAVECRALDESRVRPQVLSHDRGVDHVPGWQPSA